MDLFDLAEPYVCCSCCEVEDFHGAPEAALAAGWQDVLEDDGGCFGWTHLGTCPACVVAGCDRWGSCLCQDCEG